MSDARLFDRLVGLETEYAIRFHPYDSAEPRPTNYQLYLALLARLRQQVLTVDASHIKDGVFLANGGALWFERVQYNGGWGLIEGSTPECRGPRQMLLYQRAQDHLFGESALRAVGAGQVTLIKNDRDSKDNVYGAQENYECRLAGGARLALWRAGLALLFPLMLFCWLGLLAQIALMLVYLAFAGICYTIFGELLSRQSLAKLRVNLFGEMFAEGELNAAPIPGWLETAHLHLLRLTTAPLLVGLWALIAACAFVDMRRQLLPFLLTRPVISGAGMVDGKGHFHLADKAPAMNSLIGFGGFIGERPIFNFGHFLKALAFEAWWAPSEYVRLFSERQRLQVCLGDSNMASEAEYLRIGATLLVIDAIEAGAIPRVRRVARPIRALRRLCADPSLRATLRFQGGESTMIETQRWYLRHCERFVDRLESTGDEDRRRLDEARDVLRRWSEALRLLEENPSALVGRIDWVTKKTLLDEAGGDAPWESLKKIDLKYHELSPQGYFAQLAQAGIASPMITESDLDRAVRTAPSGTPATTRGQYIREFAQGAIPLRVGWNRIVLGTGRAARVVWLHRFRRRS